MLLSPIIYYVLEIFLFLVLAYDTLGYLVTSNRKGRVTPEDYARLIYTWLFTMVLCCGCCCLEWLPLADELFLALKIFITLPVLNGTNKLKKILVDDKLLTGLCKKLGFCGGAANNACAEDDTKSGDKKAE